MPDSSRLPARPSWEQLQKQAKDLLRSCRAGDLTAVQKLQSVASTTPRLADAQYVIAREYGFETWAQLKHHLESTSQSGPADYERLAADLLAACGGDTMALQRIHDVFGREFTRASTPYDCSQLRVKVEERLAAIGATFDNSLHAAQLFLARQFGFESWPGLLGSLAGTQRKSADSILYKINWKENIIEANAVLDRDWDVIFSAIRDNGLTGLNAQGKMTDAALARLAKIAQITRLQLGGSLQLTDDGVHHLARMTQLQELDLSGWKGGITDRGLEALQHLEQLRRFDIGWQQNITDAGIEYLKNCHHLEFVNLMGTPAGDGAIRALAGKPNLQKLRTGRNVTDEGIAALHQFPAFAKWRGGELQYGLMGFDAGPTFLLLDGPFTDFGVARLGSLNGLFGLNFFRHCPNFTPKGLAGLRDMANLGMLGCQGDRCDDDAMQHIAAMPRLRMLMAQGAVATDTGWQALSRCQTLEHIWSRDCSNLGSAGFAALQQLPALRGLAVHCQNVDPSALAALAQFPVLRELVPMGVSDEGFRYVGACERLERLWCMYCRDTGDMATEHLKELHLRTYYAGATQITDRSLELLGQMESLEEMEFWQCLKLTNSGVAHLARLPKLRAFTVDGSPGVTRSVTQLFPPAVQMRYSP